MGLWHEDACKDASVALSAGFLKKLGYVRVFSEGGVGGKISTDSNDIVQATVTQFIVMSRLQRQFRQTPNYA